MNQVRKMFYFLINIIGPERTMVFDLKLFVLNDEEMSLLKFSLLKNQLVFCLEMSPRLPK